MVSKGGKIVHANHSKIVVVTREGARLTFRRKDDDLYYMRVKRTKTENNDGFVTEISARNESEGHMEGDVSTKG